MSHLNVVDYDDRMIV